MPLFFLFMFIFYLLVNGWIAFYYCRALPGGWKVKLPVGALVILLAVGFPLSYWDHRDTFLGNAILRLSGCYVGIFFNLFLMILAADLWRLARRLIRRRGAADQAVPRRRYDWIVVSGAALLIGVGGYLNAASPRLSETTLEIPTERPELLAAGANEITIGAIADMHLGRLVKPDRLRRALRLLEPRHPDLIFFLGDTLDDHTGLDRAAMKEIIGGLTPPLGVYGIPGNHEYISGEIDESCAILEAAGITMLRDNWAAPAQRLLLVGRDDLSGQRFTGQARRSLPEILAAVPDDLRRLPLLILDHQPHHLEEAEHAGGVLQLSGHVHNGQLWPFNFVTAAMYENPRGHSRRGDTHYLVSAGTGTWGPPIRTTARPEVLLIRLRFVPAHPR